MSEESKGEIPSTDEEIDKIINGPLGQELRAIIEEYERRLDSDGKSS